MTIRLHQSCLFTSSPIADCGRDMVVPEPVLASHWPLAFIGAVLVGWIGWNFLCALYPKRIVWRQPEEPAWDTGDDERPTIEIRARRAGE
jgi:hypothetical protein